MKDLLLIVMVFISKQSAEKKILPLAESDGIQNNVSPFVDVKINKEMGFQFYQYGSNYGNNFQTANFYLTSGGVNMGYTQLNDGYAQRSGIMTINQQGYLNLRVNKTSFQNFQTNEVSLLLNPETNSIENTFYKSSTGQEKVLEFSYDGIRTNTLPNAEGDPTFTRQLVQKEDGSFGYIAKSGGDTTGLMPKVDILDWKDDGTNYIITIKVANLDTFQFSSNPTLVDVGVAGSNPQSANGITTYIDTTSAYSNTALGNGKRIGGFGKIIITFPKSSNTAFAWSYIETAITVTFRGLDNFDQSEGENYSPRRIASDTKCIKDIISAIKKVDSSLPYASWDPTYDRMLVQKSDGTIGYIFKNTPPDFTRINITIPENALHHDSYIDFKQDAYVMVMKFRFRFKQGGMPVNTLLFTMDDPQFDANFRQFGFITAGVFDIPFELIPGTVNQSVYRDVSSVKIAFDGYNFRIAHSVEIPVNGLYSGVLVLPYNLLKTY